MNRYKDADWPLPTPRIGTWEQVQVAVLMDIRDELKRLNALLHCHRFVGIPKTLDRLDRRFAKKRPLKGSKA